MTEMMISAAKAPILNFGLVLNSSRESGIPLGSSAPLFCRKTSGTFIQAVTYMPFPFARNQSPAQRRTEILQPRGKGLHLH